MDKQSLTVLLNDDGQEIAVLHKTQQGEPRRYGAALVRYLKPFKLVRGFDSRLERGQVTNSMACLAAQIIAKFKVDVGGLYIYPAGTRNCEEDYLYTVGLQNEQIYLQCQTGRVGECPERLLYSGPVTEWNAQVIEMAERLTRVTDQ